MKKIMPTMKWSMTRLFGQMRKQSFTNTLLIVITILTPMVGIAQSTTSSIIGTVTDTSGAVVVGAAIKVVGTATGIEYKATTGDQGIYRVTQLPPGSYTMQVESPGFATQNVKAFTLLVDQQARQDVKLGAGAGTQSISVSESSCWIR